MKESRKQSYLAFIGAVLLFGTIGIFRRFIPLSSGMLAFLRGILGGIFLLLFRKGKNASGLQKAGLPSRTVWVLILTGCLIGLNWMLLFEAYNYTSVPTATLCYYMQPTIVLLLSPLIFRERLTGKKLVCAGLAVLGMVFVSGVMEGGSRTGSDLKGIACGLGAAALYSCIVILNKKTPVEDVYRKTIIELFAAGAVMIPYLLVTEREALAGGLSSVSFDPVIILLVLTVGIVHTGIAYALYFAGMQGLKAQSVAVLSYLDPVSALLLAAVILGERLSLWGIVGAVLILGAALVSELDPDEKNIEN